MLATSALLAAIAVATAVRLCSLGHASFLVALFGFYILAGFLWAALADKRGPSRWNVGEKAVLAIGVLVAATGWWTGSGSPALLDGPDAVEAARKLAAFLLVAGSMALLWRVNRFARAVNVQKRERGQAAVSFRNGHDAAHLLVSQQRYRNRTGIRLLRSLGWTLAGLGGGLLLVVDSRFKAAGLDPIVLGAAAMSAGLIAAGTALILNKGQCR